jgi:hypothetical protein
VEPYPRLGDLKEHALARALTRPNSWRQESASSSYRFGLTIRRLGEVRLLSERKEAEIFGADGRGLQGNDRCRTDARYRPDPTGRGGSELKADPRSPGRYGAVEVETFSPKITRPRSPEPADPNSEQLF